MTKPDFYTHAMEAMGMYPAEVHHANGEVHIRTERESGWNDALIELTEKALTLEKWFGALTDQQRESAAYLFENEMLTVSIKEDKVRPWVIVNDVFYPCADGEDITVEDLFILEKLARTYKWEGIYAWVANKRKEVLVRPRHKEVGENYHKALAELTA